MTKIREYEIEFERPVSWGDGASDFREHTEWEAYLALVEVSGDWHRATLYDPGESPEVTVVSVDGDPDFELSRKELERITEEALDLYLRANEREDY